MGWIRLRIRPLQEIAVAPCFRGPPILVLLRQNATGSEPAIKHQIPFFCQSLSHMHQPKAAHSGGISKVLQNLIPRYWQAFFYVPNMTRPVDNSTLQR
jgi:hypothetical protein